jgi:diadenosine tetraphosphate (Ap4A) HIT family hydrolase
MNNQLDLISDLNCKLCELASDPFAENELAVAVRDGFPVSPGHSLVIPRRHFERLEEATPEENVAIFDLVSEVSKTIEIAPSPDGFNIGINDGLAAGQTIPHLHVHIIPRYTDDQSDPRGGVRLIFPERARYWEISTIKPPADLPTSRPVPVHNLAGIFKKRTNSYKYLFFRGLMSVLTSEYFEQSRVKLSRLGTEMLSGAWYSLFYFRLQLGSVDKVMTRLENILPEESDLLKKDEIDRLLNTSQAEHEGSELLRYVPQRLLTPWFTNELRGLTDAKKDRKITELSNEYFEERKPLYRLLEDELEMHPDWLEYFKNNHAVTKGWSDWEWLDYLQRRNPDVPALSKKLERPGKRDGLTEQRKFWRDVMESEEFKCIYTDEPLNPKKFELDHFLPFSFVAHDQLWNLVPTYKSTNGPKGKWNSLPDKLFLDRLVAIHHRALCLTHKTLLKADWNKTVEPYMADLRLELEQLLDKKILEEAYRQKILPEMEIAKNMGFLSGWAPTS